MSHQPLNTSDQSFPTELPPSAGRVTGTHRTQRPLRARRALLVAVAAAAVLGAVVTALVLTAGSAHPSRSTQAELAGATPSRTPAQRARITHAAKKTPNVGAITLLGAVCPNIRSLKVWGQDPNTVNHTYFRCLTADGEPVYIRLFATAGDEDLFVNRINENPVSGGQQTVIGPRWSIDSYDEQALSTALRLGGRLN